MKTSETLPRPLACTHTVPNHMLLLTLKRTGLIAGRCGEPDSSNWGSEHVKVSGSFISTRGLQQISLSSLSLVISTLQQCFTPPVSVKIIQLDAKDFLKLPCSPKHHIFSQLWSLEKEKTLGQYLTFTLPTLKLLAISNSPFFPWHHDAPNYFFFTQGIACIIDDVCFSSPKRKSAPDFISGGLPYIK